MTASEARSKALETLSSPADIPVLLAHFLGVSRSYLLAHPETALGDAENPFFDAVGLRAKGLPVAYLTGIKEFWGLPFRVTPDVLIPKPDTEILVERAIEILAGMEAITSPSGQKRPPPDAVRVLDVCTGSGCIAISLKHSCPGITVTATDISDSALVIARENAKRLLAGAEGSIRFLQGDLRDGLPAAFPRDSPTAAPSGDPTAGTSAGYRLVVCNPPYVPCDVAKELLADGRNEPALALDGGTDGLDLVRALALRALDVLARGGSLLVETGEYNAKEAADYLNELGYMDIVIHKDLEGQDRVVEGKRA